MDPYDFLTVVEFETVEGGVRVTMTADAMHDEEWTERPAVGRANELDNLGRVIEAGS